MSLRRSLVAAIAVAVTTTLLAPAPAGATPPGTDPAPAVTRLPTPTRADVDAETFEPHTLLIRFAGGASTAQQERALHSRRVQRAGTVEGTGFVKVTTDGPAEDLLETLAADPAVAEVTLDYHRRPSATPKDPIYANQKPYLNRIRLPLAWDRIKSATSQVIAVVDTGVDANHPDLKGRVVAGYNAVNPASSTNDFNPNTYAFGGHGTLVAGVAAANTNNNVGISGAAWNGRIMPIKVFRSSGVAHDSDIARGVKWAADHKAKIINMSLGGPGDSPVLHEAVRYATAKGALVVAAAGNDGDGRPQYPAAYPEVLAVGATDHAGKLTDFSSHGDWIDIAAPGFEILGTYPTVSGYHYAWADGTSFSAPLAAGVAALVRAKYPSYTPAQTLDRMRKTARDAGPRGIDPYYGWGVLDAYHAVGGPWAAHFSQRSLGANEPNDTPDRATTFTGSITGTIALEGDVDWYRYETATGRWADLYLNPPVWDYYRAQNMDPVLSIYDAQLRLIREVDQYPAGEQESTSLVLDAGTYYLAVRSYNGAADTRSYTLALYSSPYDGGTPATPEQLAVRDLTPADFAVDVPVGTVPSVTLTQPLDDRTTVQLLHGRTGKVVGTTPDHDPATGLYTLAPNAPLQDNTPYRIQVRTAVDTHPLGLPYTETTSTFITKDAKPGPVTALTAKGGYQKVTLTWTKPSISDLDKVVVRMAAGKTPPSSPTAGTSVYAGTGSTKEVTGLTGKSYSFSVWVLDRNGNRSAVATKTVIGTATATTAPAKIAKGKSVKVSGALTRKDNKAALAGMTVKLYGRKKGASSWTLITTKTTSSTGKVSHTHKPKSTWQYQWRYGGSTKYVGSRTTVTVTVS